MARTSEAQSVWHVGAGIEQSAQRNPSASPYVYAGIGERFALGYERVLARGAFDVGSAVGTVALSSDVASSTARRAAGEISLRYLHDTPWRLLGASWMVGGQLKAVLEGTQHRFPVYGLSDEFGYAQLGVGPSLRASRPLRGGTLRNDLHAGLLELVDVPYSNAKAHGATVKLSYASPARFQHAEDVVSYRVGAPGSRGVTWSYRVSFTRHDRVETRAFAHQSLGMTIDLPLGGKAR
jgi:hypothetical protein